VALYVLYRFLKRPAVTGSPKEMPKVVRRVEQSIEKAAHKLEEITTKIILPHKTVKKDAPPTTVNNVPAAAPSDTPPTDGVALPRPEQPQPTQEPGASGPRP
jgi:hypothetical protein